MDDEFDKTCPLHGCDLLDGTAPVFYGFFGTGQKYGPAGRYAWSWSAGGCSVAAGRPSVEAVRYCPVCRAAERAWLCEQIALGVDESSWEWVLAGVLELRDDSDRAAPDTSAYQPTD